MTPSANYVELIRKLRRTFVKTALAQRMCGSWSKQWLGLSTLNQINMPGSLHKYWRKCRAKIERNQRRSFDGIMIYFWWNIWKEWNRRIFQQKNLQPRQVAMLCKDDLQRLLSPTHGMERTQRSFVPGLYLEHIVFRENLKHQTQDCLSLFFSLSIPDMDLSSF